MTKFLPSQSIVNAEAAEAYVEQIADPRERAFARFFLGQAIFSVQREGVSEPSAPIDLMYFAEIARAAYAKRDTITTIFCGDLTSVEWWATED